MSLSEGDLAVFDTVGEHFQHGTIPSERFENYRNFILHFLHSPGGQAWLETGMYKFSAMCSEQLGLE